MRISRNARRVSSGRVAGLGLGKYMWVGGGMVAMLCMQAMAGPEGENVVAGSATFQRNGANTLITTGGPSTIIDYRSFNIGVNEAVRIQQPSMDSRVLNRVPNSVMPTRIDGQLTSNGLVYIANASGVYFGQHAIVNAAGLYAAAGQITNQDFLNNVNRFTSMSGDVVNNGSITAGSDAVALLGKHVSNTGSISAPSGLVALAAGDSVYLTDVRGHMMVQVSGGDSGDAAHGRGDVAGPVRPGVENAGRITARQTRLSSGDLYSLAIRMPGEIRSSDVVVQGNASATGGGAGRGTRGGVVDVSGVIDASSGSAGTTGGSVQVLGERVNLRGATIDASGEEGGGSVKVGGDYQGGAGTQRAQHTRIDAGTTIRADAGESGDGGRVIVWSDSTTGFAGEISVRGGEQVGNGGFVEVSSHGRLGFTGLVDGSAPNGAIGQLLLDPTNIRIVPAIDGNVVNRNQVDEFSDADVDGPGMESRIGVDFLNGQMTTITLAATNDITFETAVNMTTAGAGITALASNDITVNAGATITTNGGPITFQANHSFPDVGMGANPGTGVGAITINDAINTSGGGGAGTGGAILLQVEGGTGAINVNANLTTGTGAAGTIMLDIAGGGSGTVGIGGAGLVTLSTDGAGITIADAIVLDGSATFDTERGDNTNGGAINLAGSTVTTMGFGQTLTLDTSSTGASGVGGAVSLDTFTGSVGGYLGHLSVNTAGGMGGASGVVTLSGDINLDSNGGDFSTLAITGGGVTVIADSISIDTEQGDDGSAGSINLGGTTLTAASGSMSLLTLSLNTSTAVTMGVFQDGGNVTLGNVSAAGSGGGAAALNDITINMNGGMAGNDGTLVLAGTIRLDSGGGDLSGFNVSNGSVFLSGATTIETEVGEDGDAGSVVFGAGVPIDGAALLTIRALPENAGTGNAGDITINGAAGATTALTGVVLSGDEIGVNNVRVTGNASFTARDVNLNGGAGGVLSTSGAGTLTVSPLAVSTPLSVGVTASGDTFAVDDTRIGAFGGGVTFGRSDGTGLVTLGAATFASPVTVLAGGVSGDITLEAGRTFTTAAVNQPIVLRAGSGDSGTLTTGGGSMLLSGGGAIELTADSINLVGGDNSISTTSTITLQPTTPSRSMVIGAGGGLGDFALSATEVASIANNAAGILIGRTNSSGAMSINAITFRDPVTFRTPATGGSIAVNGLVTGMDNASITFDGSGATTTLNANIIADPNNDISFDDAVIVGVSGVTLTTAGTGFITFNGTVDGTSPGGEALQINTGAAGHVVFLGNVGGNGTTGVPLGSLDVNAGTVEIMSSAQHIRTDGAAGGVDFTGVATAVEVRANLTIDTDATTGSTGAGSILFGSTPITAPGGLVSLLFDARADNGGARGDVSLGAVGTAMFPTAFITAMGGNLTLNGNVTNAGFVDFDDVTTTTLAQNVTIDNTAGANDAISLRNLVENRTLVIVADTGSPLSIAGANIDTLTLTSGGTLSLSGLIETDTAQDYSNVGAIVLLADTTLTAQDSDAAGARRNITLDAMNDVSGVFGLSANGAAVSIASIGQGGANDPSSLMVNATMGATLTNAQVGGPVSVTATGGDITVDLLDAGVSTVNLTASAGLINEADNDPEADVAGGVLTLNAANGIGSVFGGLETRGTSLDLTTTGAGGHIVVTEVDDMAGDDTSVLAVTADGDITIGDTIGDLVVDSVTANMGRAVGLSATAGQILDDMDDQTADVTTTGAVSLSAGAGIGSDASGSLDVDVATVTAAAGGVNLTLLDGDAMGVTVTSATATGMGNIAIDTVAPTGTITINGADANDGGVSVTVLDADLMIGGTGIRAGSGGSISEGTVTLDALDGEIGVSSMIVADNGDITLTATDMSIGAGVSTSGDVTFASANAGNIGVGAAVAMPGLTIDNAELDRVSATNLRIQTTGGDGDIVVDGVTIADVMTVSGEVKFLARGGDNQITFSGAASQFRSLNVCADNGIVIDVAGVPLTTVGNLTLDADADGAADMGMNADSIVLESGVMLESMGDLTLNAANGTIVTTGAVSLEAGGVLTLGPAAMGNVQVVNVDSLMLTAGSGVTISRTINSAGVVGIDADSDTNGVGTLTVNSGAMLVTNDAAIDITAADVNVDTGSINSGDAAITLAVSDGSDAHLGGADLMGDFNLSALELLNFTANGFTLTTPGNVTVDAVVARNPGAMTGTINGLFTINATDASSTITFGTGDSFFDALALNADDLVVNAGVVVDGDVTIGRGTAGSIGLGDATMFNMMPVGMTIDRAELAMFQADNLTIGGANVTGIAVDNVAASDVMGITGTLTLDATRDLAWISFQGAASTFGRLTARADDGIAVDVDLSTMDGDLRLEADADNAMDTARGLRIAAGRTLQAGAALVLDATFGGIDGAGATTLSAIEGITINDSLTSDGTLTINADSDANGAGSLVVASGTVNSTTNDNIAITAADVAIVGTLNAGMGSISVARSNAGAARLGGTDPGAGVLWLDGAELGRLTSVGFTFGGPAATLVEVDGVTTMGTPTITGTTVISALGAAGQVRFINTASSFRSLTVQANSGVLVDESLSTAQGLLQIDGDANLMDEGNDIITIGESVDLTSATGLFLTASGGVTLSGGFGTNSTFSSGSNGTVSLPNLQATSAAGLTINSQGDVILTGVNLGAGTLVATADSNDDGMNTLSLRGAIARTGNLLLSAGGTGTNDTIEVFFDVNSDGAIVLQNADTVTIGGSTDPEVNLTAGNGSIDIFSNIGLIRLNGADATTNTFSNANGGMSFAPIAATNNPNLRLFSSGVASIRTIDLNNGSFTADAGLSNIGVNAASIEARNITINRNVTTQMNASFSVIVNDGGVFTTDPGVAFNLDGAFVQSEGPMSDASVLFGGSITTTNDNISFASPVRLSGGGVTMNTGAGTGDITFMDTLNGQTEGANDLALVAGTGSIRFDAAVGAAMGGRLDALSIQSATNVTFGASTFVNSLLQSAGTGTTTFTGTLISQGDLGIDLNGNIFTFSENVASINGTNGGFSLTNTGTATFARGKTFQFEGAFLQDGGGAVVLGSGITTDNDAMTFTGPVTLNSDVDVSRTMSFSTGGGALTFNGTVNDMTAGAHDLRLDAGGTGDVVFNTNATVGVTAAPRSFRASGRNVSVRETRTDGGDITLVPLTTLTDVDTATDASGAGTPGTLLGQDLRPDGVLTINGDLRASNGGTVRLVQSVDGLGAEDNNGRTFNGTRGISSVATIVFGDVNLANNAGGGTFTIQSSGDIIFGTFEKVAVFGSLTLSTPGTVTLTDVSATNTLTVNAGTIRFQSRPPAFLLDPTNVINGELNRMNPDNGPSIVARNGIALTGTIVTLGADTIPTFGAERNNNVTGAVGFTPVSLTSTQIPTPDRLRFADPDRGLTALTVNASGVGNFGLAAALAAALPRENRVQVATEVTVGKAQLEVLQAMRIYARELTAAELQDFLTGRSFYNDLSAQTDDYRVTVNRLYPPLVERLVGPYLRVFYKPKTDPATGQQVLTIEENDGQRSKSELKEVLTKALTRYMQESTGAPDPIAFRAYLETTPGEEEAYFLVENLGEFLTELRLLGLGPREELNARRAVFDPIRPNRFASLVQFERLLEGEVETAAAE